MFIERQIHKIKKMKLNPLHFIAAILLFSSAQCKKDDYTKYHDQLERHIIQWGEYEREFYTYLPGNGKIGPYTPVLFVLHGGGGTALGTPGLTFGRFNELADQEGFIVVYPQGIEKQWNDGRQGDQTKTWREDIDDTGFLVNIVEEVSRMHTIDRSRVYTCGMSNGGFMSTRLICDRPDVFRGGAILTATISEDYFPKCDPSASAAVLVMNGTEDKLVPYDGGPIKVLGKKRGVVVSTDDYLDFWQDKNQCKTKKPERTLPNLSDDGTIVHVTEYEDCKSGGALVLYRIEGGGHTWAGGKQYLGERFVGKTSRDIVACDVIWDFFKAQWE